MYHLYQLYYDYATIIILFFATFIFGGSQIYTCLWGDQLVLCFYIEQVCRRCYQLRLG